MDKTDARHWRRRARLWTGLFMAGLVLSGLSALPIRMEVDAVVRVLDAAGLTGDSQPQPAGAMAAWLVQLQQALHTVEAQYPFLAYGTDWLAFAHFVVALAFVWAWRDPARCRWLFDFGLIACAAVIPWAFFMGALRGIPLAWRAVDMCFGVLGAIPLWLARRATQRMAGEDQPR